MSPTAASALLQEWSFVDAIDHHCHPLRRWPFIRTQLDLRSAFTEALDQDVVGGHAASTVAYQDAIHRLAAHLGCEATEAAVLERRQRADPATYAKNLFEPTRTERMLVDTGFAGDDSFALKEQQDALGIPQHEVVRLETLAESLVESVGTAAEWLEATRVALREAVQRGAVGVKTICAYRASLRLRPVADQELGDAFDALKDRPGSGGPPRLTGNSLCHALLFEAARECRDLDVPLQVHCGFGDPDEDLAETSPLGLRPLFIDPNYRGLKIALLHCYPYHRAAAYLCSVFPGVFMDLSLTIPFAGLDGFRAMKETLGLCPTSKLLYASDATRYPEVYFVAATTHREALAEALGELVDRNVLSHHEAMVAGRQVLAENARQIYRLA